MDAALAAWGMRRVSEVVLARQPVYHIWPENNHTWRIWSQLQTQWREAWQGRTGLDYTAVTSYLREVERIKPRDFASVFRCIQAMESAALDVWEKKRQQSKH